MQESEQIIALYHTGFIVCLCLAVVFAALSVFLFLKFRIRKVFNFITGRAEKRTIRQMEEENAQTGKLRQDTYIPEATGDLYTTPSGSVPPVIYPPTGEVATGMEPTEKIRAQADAGKTPDIAGEGAEATTLLNTGTEDTMLLYGEPSGTFARESETVLLTPEMERAMEEERETRSYAGRFEIIKEVMMIHTEERI